ARGVVGSEAERRGELRVAGAKGDAAAGDVDVDNGAVVDPGVDPAGGDLEPEGVPTALFEIEIGARFVVGSVPAVDAREADDVAAPASGDPGAEGVFHREGQAGEEISALEARGLEANFVVGARIGSGPGDASHGCARSEDDVTVFDADGAASRELAL